MDCAEFMKEAIKWVVPVSQDYILKYAHLLK